LTQTGTNNSAGIEQEGMQIGQAVITQVGDGNSAGGPGREGGIVQLGSRGTALIMQNGSRNVAGVVQDHTVPHSEASIERVGSENVVQARQQGGFLSALDARQEGTRNVAYLSQVGVDFLIRTRQTGTDNSVVITQQNGGYAGPVVEQSGVGNSATITQYQDAYSGVHLSQTGMLNNANISQNRTDFTYGMSVVQNGTGNHAEGITVATSTRRSSRRRETATAPVSTRSPTRANRRYCRRVI
jgi:hypothetical protein